MINLFKILLSITLGLLIGYEREKEEKPAGLRDIALVTLGATLFCIVGKTLFGPSSIDIARLFYAPIVGIGFLGGGVIMTNKKDIEGVTTASVLWAMVGIGLLVGVSQYFLSIITALFIYGILKLKHVIKRSKK